MTLSDLTEGEREDRFVVPFWNWSSISVVAGERDSTSRVVLNETGHGHGSDVDCSGFINVP